MSRFNSSISVLGIQDGKVQQAILKLLENSNSLFEQLKEEKHRREEDVRLLKQKLATIGGM